MFKWLLFAYFGVWASPCVNQMSKLAMFSITQHFVLLHSTCCAMYVFTCAIAGESSPMPSRPQPKCTCSRVRGVCMSPFALASFVVRIKFARCPLEAAKRQRNQPKESIVKPQPIWGG